MTWLSCWPAATEDRQISGTLEDVRMSVALAEEECALGKLARILTAGSHLRGQCLFEGTMFIHGLALNRLGAAGIVLKEPQQENVFGKTLHYSSPS